MHINVYTQHILLNKWQPNFKPIFHVITLGKSYASTYSSVSFFVDEIRFLY